MATEWIYGAIFVAYIACFIFIASYMVIRKKRNNEDGMQQNFKQPIDENVPNSAEEKKNL